MFSDITVLTRSEKAYQNIIFDIFKLASLIIFGNAVIKKFEFGFLNILKIFGLNYFDQTMEIYSLKEGTDIHRIMAKDIYFFVISPV